MVWLRRALYRRFFETPGSWLYGRQNLVWLSDPILSRQLPLLYRVFARYCTAQRQQPVGVEVLLRGIIALQKFMKRGNGIFPLRLEEMDVFLDLQDPRFLAVPRELAGLREFLGKFLRPGDSFIDAGANHGAFSIAASQLVGPEGLVVAIEPQPRLAFALRQSLARSPAKFELHQIACGARPDEVDFYIPSATSGSAGLFRSFSAVSRHKTIRVAVRGIDDILDWRRLPGRCFIKLDVEGSELAFLVGASRLIRAMAPPILIEINPGAMRAAGTCPSNLVKTLQGLGYDRFVTRKEMGKETILSSETIVEGDIIVLPA